MKALSLTRPWGILAVLGDKEWETRPRRYYHYGHTFIHSSDGFPRNLLQLYPGGLREVCSLPFFKEALLKHGIDSPEQLIAGAIIGLVEIVRYARTHVVRDQLSERERAFGIYKNGRWAYQFKNPQQLVQPVACKGQLGLWNVPDKVMKEIREQNPGIITSHPHTLPFASTEER